MHVNRNDAYPQGTYDKDGKLVPLGDESEENTAAREAVILFCAGHSPNHPADVFPDYVPGDQSVDDPTDAQTQINKVFEQRGPTPAGKEGPGASGQGPQGNPDDPDEAAPLKGSPNDPDATRDDGKGGTKKVPYGSKAYEVPINADTQDRSHAHTVDTKEDYDPGSKTEDDAEGNPISEDEQDEDEDETENEDENDDEMADDPAEKNSPEKMAKEAKERRRAEENEGANPRTPLDNESPRDRRERERREREARTKGRVQGRGGRQPS